MPSAASRPCAETRRRSCCRSSRTTSGSSTPSCWSRRSAWACASARSRWTGSTTPTRGCRSCRPPPTTCAASGGCWSGAPRACAGSRSNEVAADQLLRFAGVGVVSTLGYLFLFIAWRPAARRLRRQRRRHGHRHALQHGRAPRALPHDRRAGPPGPSLRRGRRPVPGEPRPDDAGAGRGPVDRPVRAAGRAGRPHRGQPGRRRVPVRRAAGLDLPPERPCAGAGSTEVAQ